MIDIFADLGIVSTPVKARRRPGRPKVAVDPEHARKCRQCAVARYRGRVSWEDIARFFQSSVRIVQLWARQFMRSSDPLAAELAREIEARPKRLYAFSAN